MLLYLKQPHIKLLSMMHSTAMQLFCAVNIYSVIKKRWENYAPHIHKRAAELSRPSESFVAALLPAGNHPAHVDVVVGKDVLGFLDGGIWQGPCSAQDPGEVDVEEPQDVRAGIHEGRVHVVSGHDPVRGVGQDCGEGIRVKEHKTRSKDHLTIFSPGEKAV